MLLRIKPGDAGAEGAGALAVGLIMWVSLTSASGSIPTSDELLSYLRFNDADRARVLRGEVVGKDFPRTTRRNSPSRLSR